jgi:hypothetical protein
MPLDPPTPPAGEEIHIPGPSLQPLLLTAAITLTLIGVTFGAVLWVPGVILTLVVIGVWIRDARAEFDHLPAGGHLPGTTETVPRAEDRPDGE